VATKNILGPNTTIKWNGTDLSQFCTNLTGTDAADKVDVTGFGENYREFGVGLKDAGYTATFVQDFTSGGPHVTLSPSYYNNTAGTLKINPDTSGTVVFTLISKLYNYNAVNGGPGAANTVDVEFANAGTAGVTVGTA